MERASAIAHSDGPLFSGNLIHGLWHFSLHHSSLHRQPDTTVDSGARSLLGLSDSGRVCRCRRQHCDWLAQSLGCGDAWSHVPALVPAPASAAGAELPTLASSRGMVERFYRAWDLRRIVGCSECALCKCIARGRGRLKFAYARITRNAYPTGTRV